MSKRIKRNNPVGALVLAVVYTVMLSACSASAELRDGSRPQPTPQPAQPQVIVIQQPSPPTPQPRDDAGPMLLALFVMFTLPMCTLAALAYGYKRGRAAAQQELPYQLPAILPPSQSHRQLTADDVRLLVRLEIERAERLRLSGGNTHEAGK